MRRILLALSIALMLVAAGCAQDEPEVEETPEEVDESPTPEAAGTFQLQGRILETVASVEGEAAASPSPAASPTASPSPTGTETPEEEEPEETPAATAGIERGAPGSMSIRLTSYTGEATDCSFNEGDTLAVAYTRTTTFTPADLTENARFPRNLRETNVNVQGTVLDEENCILVADSVGPQTQASPTVSPTPDGDEESPSPSPSPTS
jgi:hypothetical protein